jgi:NADH-quinone oxidoreductase subunit C
VTDPGAGAAAVDEATPEPAPECHGWPLVDSHGQQVVHCSKDGYLGLLSALKADGFDMCADVCGVDYLAHMGRALPPTVAAERFEIVVNLVSLATHERIRVRAQVPDGDAVIPTLFHLWPGSEAPEREVFDMFGIRFEGHPDLTRILMPEDWEGYPLRKDYAMGRIPVQFKEAPSPR